MSVFALLPLSLRLTPDLGQRDHGVRIAESAGKGMGAFATRAFETSDTVGDYTGEMISSERHTARYEGCSECWSAEDAHWLASRGGRGVSVSGDYVVRVTEDILIDAEDPDVSSWCRFINHDPKPNLALKVLPKGIDGKPRVWFVALRPVAVNDELCFDYGPDFWVEELDGVATEHHKQIEPALPPSPWYKQGSQPAVGEPLAAWTRAVPTAFGDDFVRLEDAMLGSLLSWKESA
eukprot:scaffold1156_cov131-Isochrysis_galbana.AAC.2